MHHSTCHFLCGEAAPCLSAIVPLANCCLRRYADILYTLGGNNNLKIARAYFAKAVELSGGTSARALWGVMLCATNSTEKVGLVEMASWCFSVHDICTYCRLPYKTRAHEHR